MRGKQQNGLTLVGFVMVLAIAGFAVYIGMKLFPVYTEYYSVVKDMNGIRDEAGVAQMAPDKIRQLLFRRFFVSYVESVKNEHVFISRQNGYNLRIRYEVRRPLVGNLDFVAKFDRTVDLSQSGGD